MRRVPTRGLCISLLHTYMYFRSSPVSPPSLTTNVDSMLSHELATCDRAWTFRALSRRLKYTVRRHTFNVDSFSASPLDLCAERSKHGLVFKAHRLCVSLKFVLSLDSMRETKLERRERRAKGRGIAPSSNSRWRRGRFCWTLLLKWRLAPRQQPEIARRGTSLIGNCHLHRTTVGP